MSITLAQLRTRFEVLYDVSGSTVLDATTKNQLINDGLRALWAEVTAVNKDFRVNILPFTLTTGQSVSFPADFREIRAVRRDPGTTSQTYLTKFGMRTANSMVERTYRPQGSLLFVEPIPRAAGTYDLVYVPTAQVLAADGDILDVELEMHQDFIILVALCEALAREETDISQWLALLNGSPDGKDPGARGRVRRWAADQRSADPDTVEDVRKNEPWMWVPP